MVAAGLMDGRTKRSVSARVPRWGWLKIRSRWCPNGASEGRLMPTLGRRPPAPITTFRHWNTVTTLAQMLDV